MCDIPAKTQRHRTFGSSTEPPERSEANFRYTDDFHSTSTSVLTQHHPTTPSPPHHPITPITPSPIIHHPSPITHRPSPITHPTSNSLSSPRPPLPSLTQSALSTSIVPCSLFSCLFSYFRTRAARLGNQSIACDNGSTAQSPIAITVPGRSSLPRSQDF